VKSEKDQTRHGQRRIAIRAWRAVDAATQMGKSTYRRERHLPRLLPLAAEEIADESSAGRRRILLRLARALRSERARARGGHWTYDLNRHLALSQAYAAEAEALGQTAPSPARTGRAELREKPGST
jgi:hypothetical protein